ncbi:MAG: 16S rRNA (cytidine(1402)-2'-O)-methyltransferase [Sphingosinicella sp.]
MTLEPGLYIVATPIGNLSDLSPRAADILSRADVIAAEDKRVTSKLLRHIGATTPMTLYHDHVADKVRPALIERARTQAVALVSDAGTPLISDPGFKLVREARAAGITVTTIPGPCAAIAGLTLAGLPTDRFAFFGFLPARAGPRDAMISDASAFQGTLIFFESARRLATTLMAMRDMLGDREAAVVREISKRYEETITGTLAELTERFLEKAVPGEIVILVGPASELETVAPATLDRLLRETMRAETPSRAAATVARRLGLPRRQVYERAQQIKDEQ